MKVISARAFILMAVFALISSCGGSGDVAKIEGPTLSISEAKSLVVDHFYINGGLDGEFSNRGEFSIYLRDSATGKDVACTAYEDGMARLAIPGMYYGGLSIPFVEVEGEKSEELARFKLIFVEQDFTACPGQIGEEDEIVGETAEFSFDRLLATQLWSTNGLAMAVIRGPNEEAKNVRQMAPAIEDGLFIDKLYFENGQDGDKAERYYIFISEVENGKEIHRCELEDDYIRNIRYGNMLYAALGYPISCIDPAIEGFLDRKIKFGLYLQKNSGMTLVGETEAAMVMDLIGERAGFTNSKGYISFRGVMKTPFSSSVVRLEELTQLEISELSYKLTPSAKPTLELHITDSSGDYIIACSGQAQGFAEVSTPDDYADLEAGFVAATGQKELFGWSKVLLRLVDRNDAAACPAPYLSAPTILGESEELSAADLSTGIVTFKNAAGEAVLIKAGK